ncbi:restriction endonuclease [Microbacterium deminutum]|uniref:Restriction endonuclease n=2 Tax=Microbacterium deminutum TaxID=344164 RepID=A0ABP5D1N8_9MICO
MLGGSAKAREIIDYVVGIWPDADDLVGIEYPNRAKSIFIDRAEWGRSTAKMIGALEQPARGVYLITPLGRSLVDQDEITAQAEIERLNSEYRRLARQTSERTLNSTSESRWTVETDDVPNVAVADEQDESQAGTEWQLALLQRLHALPPAGFEEFVLYLLRSFGLELRRVGGSGDEGIDGIGTAPISPVLSSRVAVQVKRYNPDGKPVGREVVALFQRDAQTKGAERAILVTLGRFTEPARLAAISSTPTVDLIDGSRLAELVLSAETGIKLAPVVDTHWFDRFD